MLAQSLPTWSNPEMHRGKHEVGQEQTWNARFWTGHVAYFFKVHIECIRVFHWSIAIFAEYVIEINRMCMMWAPSMMVDKLRMALVIDQTSTLNSSHNPNKCSSSWLMLTPSILNCQCVSLANIPSPTMQPFHTNYPPQIPQDLRKKTSSFHFYLFFHQVLQQAQAVLPLNPFGQSM